MPPTDLDPTLLEKMRQDWDEQARENARHFIATGNSDWETKKFFNSGGCASFTRF